MCAVCGDKASISVDDSDQTEAHKFTITANAPEIDVRTFGSGDYGEWLSCIKDGNIVMNTYVDVDGLAAGNTADIVCNVGGQATLTANNCACTSVTVDADAKGIIEWTYTFKLTGDISGW